MNLCIIADKTKDIKIIEHILRDSKLCKLERIDFYYSSFELFFILEEKKVLYEIFIINMKMPLGMDFATKLRENNINCLIIFISSSIDHAIDAYEVDAFRYITESHQSTKLIEAINAASEYIKKTNSKFYIVETSKQIYKIRLDDIIYIYRNQKKVIFVTKNGNITQGGTTIDKLHKEFSKNFILVDRGSLVNLDCIIKLSNNEVVVENGDRIAISRPKCRIVKELLKKYWNIEGDQNNEKKS